MKAINPFRKKLTPLESHFYYLPSEPIYKNGDYAIYQNSSVSWVYTYKNLAFNELAGKNIEHLNNVANRTEPQENQNKFLYNRAIETINNNLNLVK